MLMQTSSCRDIVREVHSVVEHARMFAHKPDGQVTIINLRDANDVPVTPMQDPLHYPFGTDYLMPGRDFRPR